MNESNVGSNNFLKVLPIDFNDFDNLVVTDFDTHGIQPISFISMDDKPVAFQTNDIKITDYGIPRLNSTYYDTDSRREHINIALDSNQSSCNELRILLERLDNYFGSENMRKKLFGKRCDRYEYLPVIRSKNPIAGEKKPDYCKIKLKIHHTNGTVVRENGNKIIQIKTITDMARYVNYNLTAKFIIRLNKIWAMKGAPHIGSKIIYGVGLLMREIEIISDSIYYAMPNLYCRDIGTLKKVYKKYIDNMTLQTVIDKEQVAKIDTLDNWCNQPIIFQPKNKKDVFPKWANKKSICVEI